MKSRIGALFLAALLALPTFSCAQAETGSAVKIKPKKERTARDVSKDDGASLLQPDVSLIDAPTSSVLDYGGYSSQTRFFSQGGVLQYVSFGVFHRLNLGASANIDGLIGNEKIVRVRAPQVQVKYRFYEGDRYIPSFALGFDGQGWLYSSTDKRYNQRQRGFYIAGTQELGLPGLQLHPSINISDFDSNAIFGSLPLSLNIRDKASIMVEWDNINNWGDSRLNSGLRVYVTPNFNIDFAVRGIGQGGHYQDGARRGPERVVQLRYSGNF